MLRTSLVTLAALAPAVAWAGAVVLPTPPIVGDGVTSSVVYVTSADLGAKYKVKADLGKVVGTSSWPGTTAIEIVPPAVTSPTEITLSIKVRGAESTDLLAKVKVVPPLAGGFAVTMDPPQVAAGQSAQVKVKPRNDDGRTPAQRPLKATVSHGKITDLVPSGDGYVGTYTAPSLDAPQNVLLAVADAADPFANADVALLPVTVERSITLDAPPDASCVLVLGDQEYGPNKASPAGKVSFKVPLHPARPSGTLRTVTPGGVSASADVPLPVKSAPAVVVGPLPAKAPAGAELAVPVFCAAGDGGRCEFSSLSAASQRGSASVATPADDHRTTVRWALPADQGDTLTVSLGDARSLATVATVEGAPTVRLTSDPAVLAAGASEISVTAHLKDAKGAGIVGKPPEIEVDGGKRLTKPVDNKDGSYTAKFKVEGDRAVARATRPMNTTGLPTRRIVAWAESGVVAPGSTVDVVLVAEDALGQPVAGVPLSIATASGDGSIAPSVTTDASGRARATYRAGTAEMPVAIAVNGAGFTGVAVLWQGVRPATLGLGGSPAERDAVARWQDRLPSLVVGRGAQPAPPTAAAPVAGTPMTSTAPSGGGGAVGTPPAPAVSSGAPWLRARVSLVNAPMSYRSVLVGDAAEYAPEAKFALSPIFGGVGVDPNVEIWLGQQRTFGLDARVFLRGYRVAVGAQTFTAAPIDLQIGARLKVWDSGGDWSAYAGLGFHRSAAQLFAYTDDTMSAADVVNKALLGGRLSGGIRGEWDHTLLQGELSETFAPFPVITRLDVLADVPLGMAPVDLTFGTALEARHATFNIVTDAAKMRVRQLGWELRAGVMFPLP